MSMFNDIEYRIEDHQKNLANATEVTEHAKQFELGHWCFCGLGQADKYGIACAQTSQTEQGMTSPGT